MYQTLRTDMPFIQMNTHLIELIQRKRGIPTKTKQSYYYYIDAMLHLYGYNASTICDTLLHNSMISPRCNFVARLYCRFFRAAFAIYLLLFLLLFCFDFTWNDRCLYLSWFAIFWSSSQWSPHKVNNTIQNQ